MNKIKKSPHLSKQDLSNIKWEDGYGILQKELLRINTTKYIKKLRTDWHKKSY